MDWDLFSGQGSSDFPATFISLYMGLREKKIIYAFMYKQQQYLA